MYNIINSYVNTLIGLDYSKWDKWIQNPDDPETLNEIKQREEEATKKRAIFNK